MPGKDEISTLESVRTPEEVQKWAQEAMLLTRPLITDCQACGAGQSRFMEHAEEIAKGTFMDAKTRGYIEKQADDPSMDVNTYRKEVSVNSILVEISQELKPLKSEDATHASQLESAARIYMEVHRTGFRNFLGVQEAARHRAGIVETSLYPPEVPRPLSRFLEEPDSLDRRCLSLEAHMLADYGTMCAAFTRKLEELGFSEDELIAKANELSDDKFIKYPYEKSSVEDTATILKTVRLEKGK